MSKREREYNFSAGPSRIPEEVKEDIKAALSSFKGWSIGIGEVSHRDKKIVDLMDETKAILRWYLAVPPEFTIIFCAGGVSHQFAQLPLNFLREHECALYLINGRWTLKAYEEAKRVGRVFKVEADKPFFSWLHTEVDCDEDIRYVHYASNNTVYGTQYSSFPLSQKVPLACDATSDVLQRQISWEQHSIVYGSTYKNMGIPGLALVIVRNDELERGRRDIPNIFNYRVLQAHNGIYNTLNTVALLSINSMLKWIAKRGNLKYWQLESTSNAQRIYSCLDSLNIFSTPVRRDLRSSSNIVFTLGSEALTEEFLSESQRRGMYGLRGHRSIGGCRASLYLGTPKCQIEALICFLQEFSDCKMVGPVLRSAS